MAFAESARESLGATLVSEPAKLWPMRAFIVGRSYDTYGGGLPLAAAGDLLEEAASRADCGLDHFEATAFLLSPGIAASHLQASQATFEADRSRLPRIRWERSKRKLTLEYESHIATAQEMHIRHNFSRRLVLAAIDELAAFLNDQRPTLAKKAGLDEELFIRTVESLGASVPATDADIETFYHEHRARLKELEALLPWWERLEVDWKRFHPSARTLLNDEFFWSESDEFSPHGNDTGHDLFDDLRRWRRSHAATPPLDFLAHELLRWGFDPAKQDDEIDMYTRDQAAIALAFGLIKLEGSCDPATGDAALAAIGRQQDPSLAERFGWRPPTPDMDAAYAKLRAVLVSIATPSRIRPLGRPHPSRAMQMDNGLANHSRARVVADRFAAMGAPRGTVGYVIEVYPDGAYEVEVSDSAGNTLAQFVANRADLELDVPPESGSVLS